MKKLNLSALLIPLLGGTALAGQPLHIDLTPAAPPAIAGHLGLGETNAPGGRTLWADSRCIYRDGQPIMPVMGEFHFSRYPSNEWREALLKMKAGGVDIVATYVFWIHHEEEQGKFDWSGQRSLRDFLKLCKELDLLAVVRMGPWAHGEVRNGGFPDWVQKADFWADQMSFKNRTTHPEFMKWTEGLYLQIARQMQGLLWKEGGPVIGVQHDNECWNPTYLMELKMLARNCGIDVPFYTMTGWNAVPIPDEGLIPLFGGYVDGFWMDDPLGMRKAFLFTPIRDDGDMGAVNGRLVNTRPERNAKIQQFPFLCCEIGGGMPSSYDRRIHVTPADVAASTLVKLGEGNNLPGYYMYHGGVNPEGKLTTLNETKATHYPNDLPVKDYDFGPVGACGQLRDQYFLLRQQHLFLRSFGGRLAQMSAFFPDLQPASLDDVDTVRWNVRSDGRSGFIFFNNHQRYVQLPSKRGVQFALGTTSGTLAVPEQPITLPSGSFGLWPFNLDCGGVQIVYATAQPLCSISESREHWFFFAAIDGIQPEFSVADAQGKKHLRRVTPGTGVAFREKSRLGTRVNFVVLPPAQAKSLWKLKLAGRERIVMSPNTLLPESADQLRLEWLPEEMANLAVFPSVKQATSNGARLRTSKEGVFERLVLGGLPRSRMVAELKPVKQASSPPALADAMEERSWSSAAVWRVGVPQDIAARKGLLRLSYVGDVARFHAGDRLLLDNFFNGQPFDLALWRLTPSELAHLELRIMPYRKDKVARLPEEAKAALNDRNHVAEVRSIELLERRQIKIVFWDGPR